MDLPNDSLNTVEVNSDYELGLAYLRVLTGDPDAEFRHHQWEVIDDIVNRNERILLRQRTGWGKSAVYFIAAKLLRERGQGPTVIVSPLIALMRGQAIAANRILRAGALHTGTSNQSEKFLRHLHNDSIDILLLSPERFASQKFQNSFLSLLLNRTSLLVVDEAHCISDWGHDFRPNYKRLVDVVRALPQSVPILATTATASTRVIREITEQLGDLRVWSGPLSRTNIWFQRLPEMSVAERLGWLAEHLPTIPGQGIVYVLTKHDAEQVAEWLNNSDIDAHAYHADLVTDAIPDSLDARKMIEDEFSAGQIRILVATSALGLGYDNPDIRFVIHYQSPYSLMTYYQQAGRAGRGIEKSIAILMHDPMDRMIGKSLYEGVLPHPATVDRVVRILGQHGPTMINRLSDLANATEEDVDSALNILAAFDPPVVRESLGRWERFPVELGDRYDQYRERVFGMRKRQAFEMHNYLRHTSGCLMQLLMRQLDDTMRPAPCGRCDVCRGKPVLPVEVTKSFLDKAQAFVDATTLVPINPRRTIPARSMPISGLSGDIPADQRIRTGQAMTRWSDEGISRLIEQGKKNGRFDDQIIEEAAKVLKYKWNVRPEYVTFVPSLRDPVLVQDLALRIAQQLGIRMIPCVSKVKQTSPQKYQEKNFNQCHNLDGAFQINGAPPRGRVLLIDDITDSGWTFAIVGLLLRRAGSGEVFPFALASTRKQSSK
jgi:ATP-dependent DNA helicase RecQ